jgi:hypothetical protein
MTFQPGANLYGIGVATRPENVEVPHLDTRAPGPQDYLYPVGKRWIFVNTSEYVLLGITTFNGASTANWVETVSSAGDVISVTGTTNQITASPTTGAVGLNIPSTFVAPGTIAATSGFVGQTNGTPPSAGNIGEQIRSTVAKGSAIALITAIPVNVTSISLTPGIWDVTGIVMLTGGATTGTIFQASVNNTSATLGTLGDNQVESSNLPTATADCTLTIPAYRESLGTTTTVYLVTEATFSTGTPVAYGRISATRVA